MDEREHREEEKKGGCSKFGCLLVLLLSVWVSSKTPLWSYLARLPLSAVTSKEPPVSRGDQPIDDKVRATAQKVVTGLGSEKEKARAVFEWVAKNIEYDVPALYTEDKPNQSAGAVLARGNVVCQGYANLYRDMSRAAGLECEVVRGLVRKRKDYESPLEFDRRHAWNAVSVEGRWLLLDPTWASGHADHPTKTFRSKFDERWYNVAPLAMVHSHLPDESRWQLIEPKSPYSLEQFEQLPLAFFPYFQFGLKPVSHPLPTFAAKDRVSLEFASQQDVELKATLLTSEGKRFEQRYTNSFSQGRKHRLEVSFPKPGLYHLWVHAGMPEQTSQSALVYVVEAEGGGRPLPRLEQPAYRAGLKLLSHPHSNFEVAQRVEISFSSETPQDASLALTKEDEQITPHTLLTRQGDRYTAEVTFPSPGEYRLSLFLGHPGEKKEQFAASYEIIANQGGGLPLPTIYSHNWEVDSVRPRRPLRRGQTETLQLRVPRAKEMWAELSDGQRSFFQADGDLFTIQLKPSTDKKLNVFANTRSGEGKAVATYSVTR